jgi:hypothetical protein
MWVMLVLFMSDIFVYVNLLLDCNSVLFFVFVCSIGQSGPYEAFHNYSN